MVANPDDFWPGFGNDKGAPEVTCDDNDALASKVLTYYDIPCNSSIGGTLADLDIKHMDAMQVIKLSLLESSADDDKIYEPVMTSEGTVDFVAVGEESGLSGGDVYYEIQTSSYKEDCTGVLITGKKKLPYRRPIEWHSIWEKSPVEIYDMGALFNNQCHADGFNQYCTIIYNDPNLLNSSYEDGIDNLYEITKDNPYDNIIGYATYVDWEKENGDDNAKISFASSSRILIDLNVKGSGKGLGKLLRRPELDPRLPGIDENLACYENTDRVDFKDGVPVPIPNGFRFEDIRGVTRDKLIDIDSVYIVGLEIAYLYSRPKVDSEAVKETPADNYDNIFVYIEKTSEQTIGLRKGEHFAVAYDTSDSSAPPVPYIVFADNSLKTDPIRIIDNKPVHFYIDPDCSYSLDDNNQPRYEGDGYILPISARQGILVKQAFALVNLDTPSINIYHPDGFNNRARAIAESLEYLVAPLVVVDEPPPIAFNGTLIDQISGIVDHDPTTAQDFEDTDLEKAYDQMSTGGGGMSLNLPFLDEDQTTRLSGALYNYMNSGTGTESTYVCSPTADVVLGGLAPNGGIINAISYSYQDQNSYTISVNTGSKILGEFAQPGVNGPSFKAAEDVSFQGTIIQDMGDNIYYKVRIDGYGERIAVNMVPAVLRAGDKVTVAVHNNPMEA